MSALVLSCLVFIFFPCRERWRLGPGGEEGKGAELQRRTADELDLLHSESDITIERIRKILAAGANVILTTKGIDDLCLKEFVEAGAMAVRRCKKEDLRRIAKATGATMVSSLANLEGEETFEASSLGSAEEVVQERISDDELILVKGTKVVSSSSIILRGANGELCLSPSSHPSALTSACPSFLPSPRCSFPLAFAISDFLLDEMERALHDSLCVIKRTLESGSVVPGGGAVETALSIYLENFATTLVSHHCLLCSLAPFSLLLASLRATENVAGRAPR